MIHNRMCVTHNNIARGDSLIAFASLTISAKSIKIRLSHNLSNLFCENCAFLSNGSGSKAILERAVNSLIFWKKLFCFWVFFTIFSNFFFYTYTWQSYYFFMLTYFRKRYVFFQKGDYLFFVYFVMFSKGIIRLFLKYNNQKIMEREEIERSKWKKEAFKIASKKVYFELETDLYLAKIFDFEFQHHDHQTSL